MADETVSSMGEVPTAEERIGFCQDCGRPLTAATIKTVGSGVFCEPCLERRLAGGTATPYGYPAGAPVAGQTAGQGYWQGANGAYPPPPPVPPPPISLNAPSPGLAGFLGLIPGVGAMYNGQFAKGVVHLIVFAVLVSLSDNVNGVFGLFVAGWIFFMAFEAYHTARARRDGLPLPDPFGWNNIGERMGFGKGFGFVNVPGSTVPPPPFTANPYTGPATGTDTDWVGYVTPTNFATTPDEGPPVNVPFSTPSAGVPYPSTNAPSGYAVRPVNAQATQGIPYAQVPYSQPATYAPAFTGVDPVVVPVNPSRRFPVGAIWLIGLGLLFLLGNISPSLQLNWHWMMPLVLALLAVWMFARRLGFLRRDRNLAPRPALGNVICGLRAPILLMTLAVLWTLQSAYILTLGQTWPVIIIVFGALLVLERTVGRGFGTPGVPIGGSIVPASGWSTSTEPAQPAQPVQGGQ